MGGKKSNHCPFPFIGPFGPGSAAEPRANRGGYGSLLCHRLRSRLIDLRTGLLVAALATATTAAAVDITFA